MEQDKIIKIELTGLRFYGSYGLYEVESKWNTELLIDASVFFKIDSNAEIQLTDTVDYQKVSQEIQLELNKSHKLLETIASNLIKRIKKMDSKILSCKIKIYKKPLLSIPLLHVAVEMEF